MDELFAGVFDGRGGAIVTAIAAVAAALLVLVIGIRLFRGRSNSTFIRGGRNRQPRLAVVDAAAVDTRRRIVLLRRDNVEHLIMIGGPTDLVIESRILQPDILAVEPIVDRRDTDETPAKNDFVPPIQPRAEPAADAPPPVMAKSAPAPVAVAPAPETPVAPLPRANPVVAPAQPERQMAPPAPRLSPEQQHAVQRQAVQQPAPVTAAPIVAAPLPAAFFDGRDPADILDEARGRVLAPEITHPITQPVPGDRRAEQFPPEKFTMAASASAPSITTPANPPAVSAGNPFDEVDFASVLDAEMAGDLSSLDIAPAPASNQRPAPSVALDTPAARKPEPSLEDEMAKLLGEMQPTRR